METIVEILNALNAMSPIAVIGLLGTVIFMMVKGRTATDTKVEAIASNHLHDLPAMCDNLEKIVEILQRMEVDNATEFSYIRTRLNGGNTNGRRDRQDRR